MSSQGPLERRDAISAAIRRVDGQAPSPTQPLSKHVRMAESPFRFLRGAAQMLYADLATKRIEPPACLLSPPLTRIQGDCHFCNFGFLTEEGSHGERVVWAPNDFDDAAVGHAVWDLLRYGVSLHLVADLLGGMKDGRYPPGDEDPNDAGPAPTQADAREALTAFLDRYAETCLAMVGDAALRDTPLDHFKKCHFLAGAAKKARKRAAGGVKFADKSSVAKETEMTAEGPRFREDRNRFKRLDKDREAQVRFAMAPYVDDAILDIAIRLGAGTGSLNVDRYYLLVGPKDGAWPEDLQLAHVVEVKQQRPAAMLHDFPDLSPINRLNPAHLTVDCQRLMQRRPDIVLDELPWEGANWLVRSRHHARVGVDPEELLEAKKPGRALEQYAEACGIVLAQAHARGDRRSHRFEAAMAKALKKGQKDLVTAAEDYARQTAADWTLLRAMLAGD